MSMLLGVLADDAQRSPIAGYDEVGRDQKWPCLMCRFTGPSLESGIVQVKYRYRIYPSPGQQRALARAQKGSANRYKARRRVAVLHRKVREARLDHAHKTALKLVRTWACAACGTVHDRDVNAARNILAAGRADKSNACGGQVRPASLLAPAREAGTLRGAA
jgi:transposase